MPGNKAKSCMVVPLWQMDIRTTENWMQYSASHTATTALLLVSEAISENLISKNFLWEYAPRPTSLAYAYIYARIHV